jgi:HEAT repeat protein
MASAEGQRSIDVLLAGLKSQEKFFRWAAAQSLIQRKNKITAGIVVVSLNDRSSWVKSTIVQAMPLGIESFDSQRHYRHYNA